MTVIDAVTVAFSSANGSASNLEHTSPKMAIKLSNIRWYHADSLLGLGLGIGLG